METFKLTPYGEHFVKQSKARNAIPYLHNAGNNTRINLAVATSEELASFWKPKSRYIARVESKAPAAIAAPASPVQAKDAGAAKA
jgi:hypothetical protein